MLYPCLVNLQHCKALPPTNPIVAFSKLDNRQPKDGSKISLSNANCAAIISRRAVVPRILPRTVLRRRIAVVLGWCFGDDGKRVVILLHTNLCVLCVYLALNMNLLHSVWREAKENHPQIFKFRPRLRETAPASPEILENHSQIFKFRPSLNEDCPYATVFLFYDTILSSPKFSNFVQLFWGAVLQSLNGECCFIREFFEK